MNHSFSLFPLFFLSFSLLAMEAPGESQDSALSRLEQEVQQAVKAHDKDTILRSLLHETPHSIPAALLTCGITFLLLSSDVLSIQLMIFMEKAIENEDTLFLQEVLFNRPLGIGFVLRAFKKAKKIELLKGILLSRELSEEQFNSFVDQSFILHYLELLKILIQTKEHHYFKEHHPTFLKKALQHKWLSLASYILQQYEKTTAVQHILNESLIEHAKAHQEYMVYFLLKMGAHITTIQFIDLWSSLSQDGQPPAAKATLDLLKLFTHSGIVEYRDNPEAFQEKYTLQTSLSIPYTEWAGGYFSSLCTSLAKKAWHYVVRRQSAANPDTTYATPINRRNDVNQTELIWAVLLNRKEPITLLLKRGAHVNARDSYNRTALFYAARCADPEVVRTLLAQGACTSIRDASGKYPIEHALEVKRLSNALLILFALKEKDIKRCLEKQIQFDTFDPLNASVLNALRDVFSKEYGFTFATLKQEDYTTLNVLQSL